MDKNQIIRTIEKLHKEIDDCTTKIVRARLEKDADAERQAFQEKEAIMTATMQELSCIHDLLTRQETVEEKLQGCIGTLEGIRTSGYWPYASPAPCSTEQRIKHGIDHALANLEYALENHRAMFKNGADPMNPPCIKIEALK